MTARRVIALLLGALFIAAAVVVALNVRDEGEGLDSPVADGIATRAPATAPAATRRAAAPRMPAGAASRRRSAPSMPRT